MKLFVWTNFCPDYSGGLAVAIAKDEADARKQIIKRFGVVKIWDWGELEVRRLDRRFSVHVCGGS